MTVYIAGRQTGKTWFLIRESARTGAIIVAPTYQMVNYIDKMARDFGLKIPPPITTVDWIKMMPHKRDQKYLVDELQSALHQMNVVMATLDINSKEMIHMFGVKETCCTSCSHKDVCQFKEEYLAAQAAVDNISVNLPAKDERANRYINLRNIPWVEPVELKCKHFIPAAQNVAVR